MPLTKNQLGALVGAALLGGVIPLLAPLKTLEEASLDARFRLRGPLENKSRVVVIAIDNATERKWRTIPKAFWGGELAKVITKLHHAGISRLALDFVVGVDADTYLSQLGLQATPNQDLDIALSALGSRALLGTFTGVDITPSLREAADGRELVSVNTEQRSAGVVRRIPRVDRFLRPPLPSMAARLAQLPPGNNRPIELNYSGNPRSHTISALDLLEGRVPVETLKGALVLLGETHDLSDDLQDTPYGRIPGVFIQAEATRTALENRELWVVPTAITAALGALLGLSFGLLALRYTAGRYLLGAITFTVLWSVLALSLFSRQNIVLPWLAPTTAVLLWTPLLLFPLKIAEERRERLWARAQWGQMVSDAFVEILERKRTSGMGTMETFDAALLFLDIANFSHLTHELSPDALLEGLNRVFDAAITDIQAQGGTVFNFVGDGLCAMFPQKTGESPTVALEAALTSALQLLAHAPWDIRLGLSFGQVTLALVGSATRKQMTVYGPAVNIASRLEQAGKALNPERDPSEAPLKSALVLSEHYEGTALAKTLPLEALPYCPKGWSAPVRILYLA